MREREREREREEEGEWQQVVNRRKKTNEGRGTDDVSKLATTIFVTGFPGQWGSRDLWMAVERCGILVDAFVPRKKDYSGASYGFIRFKKVENMKALLEKLNNLDLGGLRMRANVSKFPRRKVKRGERKEELCRGRKLTDEGRRGGKWGRALYMEKNGASYKEVLKGNLGTTGMDKTEVMENNGEGSSRNEITVSLKNDIRGEEWRWLKCSLIGEMKELELISKCMSVIRAYGLGECDIRYVGGLNVMLVFNSSVVADYFLRNQKVNWTVWFSWLKAWDASFRQVNRAIWIRITGVPAGFWKESVFSGIAEKFGKLLIPFEGSGSCRNMSFGKICILTSRFGVIESQRVKVVVGEEEFTVIVKEDDEWQPSEWVDLQDS
ncbi:hypothetical protein LXL04_011618 [Taraxacum kok-saghyz]